MSTTSDWIEYWTTEFPRTIQSPPVQRERGDDEEDAADPAPDEADHAAEIEGVPEEERRSQRLV